VSVPPFTGAGPPPDAEPVALAVPPALAVVAGLALACAPDDCVAAACVAEPELVVAAPLLDVVAVLSEPPPQAASKPANGRAARPWTSRRREIEQLVNGSYARLS